MRRAYPELRRIAAEQFKRERLEHTWQPTELVHEVFLRLATNGPEKYASRAQFFAVVAQTMRRILIEHARRRQTTKRGGSWQRVSLDHAASVETASPDFLALDAALQHLRVFDPNLHKIAELRIFAGLSTEEIGVTLGRGASTIRRDWRVAKTWLQRDLEMLRNRGQ
jgi:RNA polymerase sigma factor (TIGR02999 family)